MKLQVLYALKEQKMKVKTEDVRYDNIENNINNMFSTIDFEFDKY